MNIELDLDGISAFFEIRNYYPPIEEIKNYLTLSMSREQAEYFKNYLNLVTGIVDESNPVIQCMINQGILRD